MKINKFKTIRYVLVLVATVLVICALMLIILVEVMLLRFFDGI